MSALLQWISESATKDIRRLRPMHQLLMIRAELLEEVENILVKQIFGQKYGYEMGKLGTNICCAN